MNTIFQKPQSKSDSFGFIADWTHAMSQTGELSEVLGHLGQLTNADAAVIVRTSFADQKARFAGSYDSQQGKIWPSTPSSYAGFVVGDLMATAKVGSVWKLSEMMASSSEISTTPVGINAVPSDIAEVLVVPLETQTGHIDHIELHFRKRLAEHDLNLFVMLISTLVTGWSRRVPGMVSKKLSYGKRPALKAVSTRPPVLILDIENPAHLSRCEFRICSLLKDGMTVNTISEALSVRPATVRSHLSSIFSKTNVSGQVELIHQLNRLPDTDGSEQKKVHA